MEFVHHTVTLQGNPPIQPNVNMFALVIRWQGFNGLDVLAFTAEVHVLRTHACQWQPGALPAQLLNGFSNYTYLKE